MLKTSIILFFFTVSFSQSYNFSVLDKNLREKEQKTFFEDIESKIASRQTDEDILKLNFWKVRSLYSEGLIDSAMVVYMDKVVYGITGECEGDAKLGMSKCLEANFDWEPFKKILLHEPFKKNIEECNNNKCICSHQNERIKLSEYDDLDFLSPENLIKNFSTVWLVIAKKKYFTDTDLKHDFDFNYISTVDSRASVYYDKENLEEGELPNKKVQFAILPQIVHFDLSNNVSLNEYLNNKAKKKRIESLRNTYWDPVNHKIDRDGLSDLEFGDIVTETTIVDGKFNQESPIGDDQEIYSQAIKYFPKIKSNDKFNYDNNFNRLYVFSGDHISRYLFKVGAEKSGVKKSSKKKSKKYKNDFFIYLKWDSWKDKDNTNQKWHLRDLVVDDQFKIEIPTNYFDQYSIRIAGKKYNNVTIAKNSSNIFKNGIKIIPSDSRTNPAPIENFLDEAEQENLIKIGIDTDNLTKGNNTIDSHLIFIKKEDMNEEQLNIVVTPNEKTEQKSNIMRNLLIGFLSILIIDEAL